jgi:GDP-L-fucose synthase
LGFEQELDLRNQQAVKDFMAAEKPEVIIVLPQKWEGSWPTIFRTSLLWKTCNQNNLIDTALQSGVEVYFFGSSCIYPKLAPQPLKKSIY